ncbi:MAG: putative Ser/Thr protein kinase [Planctomycetota bacterium]|jgi:predicted Ser/Thr protein kinase
MSLTTGQTLSFYEVLGPLGAGGMGEVYLARDTRLDREVAIKVLPEDMAEDEERLRRFEREAKVLASLNHTNVAGIHGMDQEGETCFLAMELVPGEDLEERLQRGTIPINEAIDICRQIAEGLEVAHEAGVVHRDLKPANIRITPEGAVKILDFGLAKPIGPKARESGTLSAESDSFLVTSEGMILGTPTYMSPEQARGKPVDRRTDIWAFGCVLFECLTGKRAFNGEVFGDLIVAILEHEADLSAVPDKTPSHVRRLIERCLIKDPRQRLRDIGEARLALSGESEESATVATRAGSSKAIALAGWIVAAGLLVFAASKFIGVEPEPTISAPSVHARILLPPTAELAFGAAKLGIDNNLLALSPDGTLLVYVGRSPEGQSYLYRQELASFDPPVAIPGTEGALHSFFSPDGSTIGFLTDDRLKRISPIGDGLMTICEAQSPLRGQWMLDDTIYLSTNQGKTLRRVPAEGGDVETVFSSSFVVFLEVLPNGKSALMLDYTGLINMNFADVVRIDLETLESRVVIDNAQDARFVSPGKLVFARAGSLHVIPFDVERAEVHGESAIVIRDVVMDGTIGQAQFVFSSTGTMAFVEGPDLARAGIGWIDRKGKEGFLPVPERTYGTIDLDPTDTQVVVQVADFENYVWSYDIASERGRRLPGKLTGWPIWSSSGGAIAYTADELQSIRIESMDGSTNGRTITVDHGAIPGAWSPDDRVLAVYSQIDAVTKLGFLDVHEGSEVEWVEGFDHNAWGPSFSPDGKWIAYSSQATGLFEILVRSYPDGMVEHQISEGGGIEAVWSTCGELFYRQGDRWMSVKIETEPKLTWSAPILAFETDFVDTLGRSYDVSSDGQKLYVIKQPNPPDGSRINVITNWKR